MEASSADGAADLVQSLTDLAVLNRNTVARYGARVVVLCKFMDAVLPELSALQCGVVARLFRQGVEEILARTDDIAMPSEYDKALLEQTNLLLDALEGRSCRMRQGHPPDDVAR